MANNRDEIPLDELVPSLAKRYFTTSEYRVEKRTESISSVHPLVYTAEKQGLEKMIKQFIGELHSHEDIYQEYVNRRREVWLDEWRAMHSLLFKYVLKANGNFRVKGRDVYFGNIGDEDFFNIPKGGNDTLLELYTFINNLPALLSMVNRDDIDDVCRFLAKIHFEFVRIHPFADGNGRIARAVTDQFAVSLGYPPVVAAFPRTDEPQKQKYHQAIRGCVGDIDCKTLAAWIRRRIDTAILDIA